MEKLMQYVWQHRLCLRPGMKTVDGRRVEVIDPGLLNTDAGPDFFKATVIIDGQTWVGDVEIHVRASDWHRHHHDGDPAYDSVVLHVVDKDDCPIHRSNGELLPQMVMQCVPDFSRHYNEMVNNQHNELACAPQLASIPAIYVTDWISNLGFERLHAKAERVQWLVDRYNGSWRDGVYVTLARALGFGTNSEPFERVAMSTPLGILLKHSDDIFSIEALLMGQAGFLGDDVNSPNGYFSALRDEYRFMSHKFGLKPPVDGSVGWKMARMRPQNFPHRRLAALAAMVCGGFRFAGNVLHVTDIDSARQLFDVRLSHYWTNCYNFSPQAIYSPGESGGEDYRQEQVQGIKALSASSIDLLIINVVVPLLYAYGLAIDNRGMQEKAVDMLQSLKPESNRHVQVFASAGIRCNDAFTSQALIELRKNYCETRKCLYCRLGHRLLAKKALR